MRPLPAARVQPRFGSSSSPARSLIWWRSSTLRASNAFETTRWMVDPIDDMPSDRTFVTELVTGLGILGAQHLGAAITERSPRFTNLTSDDWDRLESLWRSESFPSELSAGF